MLPGGGLGQRPPSWATFTSRITSALLDKFWRWGASLEVNFGPGTDSRSTTQTVFLVQIPAQDIHGTALRKRSGARDKLKKHAKGRHNNRRWRAIYAQTTREEARVTCARDGFRSKTTKRRKKKKNWRTTWEEIILVVVQSLRRRRKYWGSACDVRIWVMPEELRQHVHVWHAHTSHNSGSIEEARACVTFAHESWRQKYWGTNVCTWLMTRKGSTH